jgi:hypothetical protein
MIAKLKKYTLLSLRHQIIMEPPKTISELLAKGTGRNRADVAAGAVEQRPDLFPELVRIYLTGKEPYSRVAAWAVDLCAERHPEWIYPYIEEMARSLPGFRHDALKRHTLRMLIRLPLPEEELGTLVNVCFGYITSAKEAVAQKVFAMEILYRITLAEPDLKKELADSISWRMEEETAGFRNRGSKILKKLSR